MKAKVEKEFKMLLDQTQYQKISENEDFKLEIQDNYYFDTKKASMALRIRNVEDIYILTLKKYENNKLFEYEFRVDDQYIDHPKILDYLKIHGINEKPKYLGLMQTSRYYLKLNKGEIALDRCLYLDKIDYEIEYEVFQEKDDHQELVTFLDKYKIKYIENKKSKFQRFMEVYNEKN